MLRWLPAVLVLFALGCGSAPEFRARQRSTATIPNVPLLRVQLGDVHLGVVDLTIVDRSGHTIATLPQASDGSEVTFEYGGERRSLEVVQVEDHLLHEDYVTMRCDTLR